MTALTVKPERRKPRRARLFVGEKSGASVDIASLSCECRFGGFNLHHRGMPIVSWRRREQLAAVEEGRRAQELEDRL